MPLSLVVMAVLVVSGVATDEGIDIVIASKPTLVDRALLTVVRENTGGVDISL